MNYLFIIFSGVLVSIDALILGFSYSLKNKVSKRGLLVIGLITFIMCLGAMMIGNLLNKLIDHSSIISGILIIIIGIRNLLSSSKNSADFGTKRRLELIALGIAIGFDASVMALSLATLGYQQFAFIPICFGTLHIGMVFMGQKIALSNWKNIFLKYSFLPSIILIIIGVIKCFQ